MRKKIQKCPRWGGKLLRLFTSEKEYESFLGDTEEY
jgi:hypothetical protein